MAKNLIKVGDFYYDSRKNASAAEKELRAVEYMRENLDLDRPDELFVAYQQMIEKQIFKTEVGLDFLRDIREYLVIYATFATKLHPLYPIDETAVTKRQHRTARPPKEERRRTLKTSRSDESINPKKARKAAVSVLSGQSAARIEKKNRRRRKRNGEERPVSEKELKEKKARALKEEKAPVSYIYRELFHLTLTLVIVFAIALGCMFYIASTSNNINILNYENELLNRYSSWEQELRDKERELESWEREINGQYQNSLE